MSRTVDPPAQYRFLEGRSAGLPSDGIDREAVRDSEREAAVAAGSRSAGPDLYALCRYHSRELRTSSVLPLILALVGVERS